VIFDGSFRHWFLTWRTYGTWLPGDERGFVGTVVEATGKRVIRNAPGTPQEAPSAGLRDYARSIMRTDAVLLEPIHAAEMFAQFRETASTRGWALLALAVLANHVHVVVRVGGDPNGADVLRDFKCYASRRLNEVYGKPARGSWWSESGSRRVLRDETNVNAAVRYVREQEGALLIWAVAPPELSPAG
jgi:REP element-mobilizing transposase RayT